jgi:membrane protein YqaA with SNARE-associated domain
MTTDPPPFRTTSQIGIDLEAQVDYLMIRVDRQSTVIKMLKWAVCTAVVAGLGSIGGVTSWIYGRGIEDQTMRNGIERSQREVSECLIDIKELQRIVFKRSGFMLPSQLEDK